MAPNFLQAAKSAAAVLCLANYIFVPFDAQIMRNVFQLNWINLVAYVVIEQPFLATFRRLDYRLVGYIPLIASAAEVWMQRNQAALITAEQKEVTSFGVKRVMIDFLDLETVVQTVVDAAINVAVLVLAINISNPARPNLPLFEFGSLSVIFGGYALLEYGPSCRVSDQGFPLHWELGTG